jgi:hypothetical protein
LKGLVKVCASPPYIASAILVLLRGEMLLIGCDNWMMLRPIGCPGSVAKLSKVRIKDICVISSTRHYGIRVVFNETIMTDLLAWKLQEAMCMLSCNVPKVVVVNTRRFPRFLFHECDYQYQYRPSKVG